MLGAKGDRKLFQESQNRKKHDIDTLKENLLGVLELNKTDDVLVDSSSLCYCPLHEVDEMARGKRQDILFKLR